MHKKLKPLSSPRAKTLGNKMTISTLADEQLPDIFIFNAPSGTLQPRIHGRYKHLPKTLLKKDCFYCTHNGFYVYPLNDNEYGIGRRLGGESVVAKIKGNDILIGDILVWSQQDQDYIKYDDVDIWVDGDPEHDAGEIDYAPQALQVKSKFDNIKGGYCIIAKTCCERPVYYNEERAMYILFVGPLPAAGTTESEAELSGNWIISPTDNITTGHTYLVESKKTAATFPTECVWTDGVVVEEVSV